MILTYLNTFGNGAFVIKMNWGINLPNSDKTIYHIDDGPSFLGDGERYTILEYKSHDNIKKLDKIDWLNKKDIDFESKIDTILSNLKVKKDYYPKYNSSCRYYYLKVEDNSEIFIINVVEDNKLYIVESIL